MDGADRARADIVEVGRRLYARGLISAHEGNVSVRQGERIYVTPAGVCKGFLRPEDVVCTDLGGQPTGGGRATTEILMHVAVYRRRPDVAAVVHAHPPVATAFAVAGLALDAPLIAEAVVTLGPVPVIRYGMPSTPDLAASVAEAICGAQALLMANHGALTVGESVWRAWERMETLEHLARVTLDARLLGGSQPLPGGEVARLRTLAEAAGYPAPACAPAPPAPGRAGDEPVLRLTRSELVRIVTEAVRRFGRPPS